MDNNYPINNSKCKASQLIDIVSHLCDCFTVGKLMPVEDEVSN
jgi:hypothetical protein